MIMAKLSIYYVYLPFLIYVWSHAGRSVEGESNMYTLIFGNESTIADIHKEIKMIRERLKEHNRSLNILRKNYASLYKRLVNLENTQKLQMNDNILQKLQKFIQLKLNEQSKELVQKQNNYKKTLQDILDAQKKLFKDELMKFETKLLNKMQDELVKQTADDKHADRKQYKTPNEFSKCLRGFHEQIKKLPPETAKILNDIINLFENNLPADFADNVNVAPNLQNKFDGVNAKAGDCVQTPIEFLQNLLNNQKEIKKLPNNATTILNEIINIIENNTSVEFAEDDWPSYTTFLPNEHDKVVEVNAGTAAGVATASNCDEAIKSMQDVDATVGGIYALNMTKYNLTDMYGYCLPDLNGKGAWLIIQRRIDNELSFNRNWQDYKNGFGHLTDSFFIGLERLHKILLDSHAHLWIQLGTKNFESPHRIYTDFSIANEEDKYRITSVYIEDYKDDFNNAKGWSFQTYDVASNGTNCAEIMQGGWWYDENRKQGVCSNGNLHTKLENVYWNLWDKVVYTHMAIRISDPGIKPIIRWEN